MSRGRTLVYEFRNSIENNGNILKTRIEFRNNLRQMIDLEFYQSMWFPNSLVDRCGFHFERIMFEIFVLNENKNLE